MTDQLQQRIARVASDRESGASEILDEVIGILREARAAGVPLAPVAQAVVRAQPSMAPVWNAALAALASDAGSDRLEQFAGRVARAQTAVNRFGAALFETGMRGPLRVVTLSYSRSTLALLEALAEAREVRVACAEGRPALEGRRLAARLAAAGIPVTFFTDAAVGHALGAADAVVVGADAVSPEWVLNKSGTRLLAAAAAQQGISVYVVATRDKFVSHAVASRLEVREGAAAEVWGAPPAGVTVRNPYFETCPVELVTGLITDRGVLSPDAVVEVCDAILREQPPGLVDKLI